jgi:hypothetical protein
MCGTTKRNFILKGSVHCSIIEVLRDVSLLSFILQDFIMFGTGGGNFDLPNMQLNGAALTKMNVSIDLANCTLRTIQGETLRICDQLCVISPS